MIFHEIILICERCGEELEATLAAGASVNTYKDGTEVVVSVKSHTCEDDDEANDEETD